MNELYMYCYTGAFLLLPPLVLAARYKMGSALPWAFIVIVLAGGGWFSYDKSLSFHFQSACELVRGVESPAPDLLEHCTNDGVARVFGLYFGWLFALLYSAPFLIVFAVISRISKGRAPPARQP